MAVRINKKATELMFTRTKGQDYFILPGGKQETGETIAQSFEREIKEELSVGSENQREIGSVEGLTPDGRPLRLHLITATLLGEPKASSEVAEVKWFNRNFVNDNPELYTPILKEKVLPFLDKEGLF